MKAFVSWSGGKEISLACYKAARNEDIEVKYLLNMASEDGRHSRSHGISSDLLRLQAEAMGIPLVQGKAAWNNYEEVFKNTVLELKRQGIEAGIFGDIDMQEHRDWVERVCKETGVHAFLPLWEGDRETLLRDFINAGFKAIVVVVRDGLLGQEWLGRSIDTEFIDDLKKLGNIDLCGEKGEYHSFVYGGPIFSRSLEIKEGPIEKIDNTWILNLKGGE